MGCIKYLKHVKRSIQVPYWRFWPPLIKHESSIGIMDAGNPEQLFRGF